MFTDWTQIVFAIDKKTYVWTEVDVRADPYHTFLVCYIDDFQARITITLTDRIELEKLKLTCVQVNRLNLSLLKY